MLRFLPDSWVEGLLRPLLLVDPVAGLYLEEAAPDWRFLALGVVFLMLLGLLARAGRRIPAMKAQHVITALGLVLTFYLWTFVSGNGRYFSWGMLLVGPLLVWAILLLPTSRRLRWTALALVLVLQGTALRLSYTPNPWAVVRLTHTPLSLQDSPLRERPAVFLTVSNLTYSILVPLFHPESRWANVAGQFNVLPGTLEWSRLQKLLQSPLPMYLVTPVRPQDHDGQGHPTGAAIKVLRDTLSHQGLVLMDGGCQLLRSRLSGPGALATTGEDDKRGFSVCALERGPSPAAAAASPASAPRSLGQEALDAVERRCPRFFPPGGGRDSLEDGVDARFYAQSDVRLWVHPDGIVLYHYFRAMNPTPLGTVEEVRANRFVLGCHKLPGRYLPFWQRP
jgi:hypothetical protein